MNADTLIEIVNNPFIGVLYFLAIFYIAQIIVDLSNVWNFDIVLENILVSQDNNKKNKLPKYPFGRTEHIPEKGYIIRVYPLGGKPFNCTLCMCGWISIFLYVIDVKFGIDLFYLLPFALAGGALLISKLKERLETFIS